MYSDKIFQPYRLNPILGFGLFFLRWVNFFNYTFIIEGRKTKRHSKWVPFKITVHITMNPTGFDITRIPSMNTAVQCVLDRLYHGIPRPTQPVLPEYLSKVERNEQIRARYAAGESIADLAREYQISNQRVFQILHPEQK
jgi:hypothetical protein